MVSTPHLSVNTEEGSLGAISREIDSVSECDDITPNCLLFHN